LLKEIIKMCVFCTSYSDQENCDYEIVHTYLMHDVRFKEKSVGG
jgi:hypothetical protein